ncbi:hypothetical protein Lepto7375DRAFT_7307 [Leptolyngbya sp. PCC 7375]|nr:hypothetical protein Lepto7375DRAFT_7307 [Leptolyngbya sp. PCC 7375]
MDILNTLHSFVNPDTEAVMLFLGLAIAIFRETQKGVTLKKLAEDIKDSADSPAVQILKDVLVKDDD